jgi:hypothetical protein
MSSSGAEPAIVWERTEREDGVITYKMGRQGKRLVAEWPDSARLTCTTTGREPEVSLIGQASTQVLEKLQGVVKAMLTHLAGGLGVHASAVAIGDHAVLLLGKSGAGKSTAAAELCLRHGARLLADDAAALVEDRGIIYVEPSESHHCLTRDSAQALGVPFERSPIASGKAWLATNASTTGKVPLALVASLRFDAALVAPVVRRLDGANAAVQILGAMYRLEANAPPSELERVLRMYSQAPFVEVARGPAHPSVATHVLRSLEVGE